MQKAYTKPIICKNIKLGKEKEESQFTKFTSLQISRSLSRVMSKTEVA